MYKSSLDCKWNVNGVKGSGFRVQRVQRVQRRRWRLSPHIYMRRCPKAGRLHPCPLLLKTFPKIKKLFSIVKSFSIFGNLFTILNSLNMERKGGTPMLHPFYFAFIWFRVQGSRLRALVAASPPFFRKWYSRIAAFPSSGRCPAGADRVTMA